MYKSHKKTGPKPVLPRKYRDTIERERSASDLGTSRDKHSDEKLPENQYGEAPWTDSDGTLSKLLGLKELGLSLEEAQELESYAFYEQPITFSYSRKRFLAKLKGNPDAVVAIIIAELAVGCICQGRKELADTLYQRATAIVSIQSHSSPDCLLLKDPIMLLWAWCYKVQYELVSDRFMEFCTSAAVCSEMVYFYGLHHLDASSTKDKNIDKDFPSIRLELLPQLTTDNEDFIDAEMPLIEEKRRLFWQIFMMDKWASLITARPCGIPIDSRYPILTRLPALIGPFRYKDEYGMATLTTEESPFYEEASAKVRHNGILIDVSTGSARVLVLMATYATCFWSQQMLIQHRHGLPTDKELQALNDQLKVYDEHMRKFQSTMLYNELHYDAMMKRVPKMAFWFLYKSALVKLMWLVDESLAKDPTGASISDLHKELFRSTFDKGLNIMEEIITGTLKENTTLWGPLVLKVLISEIIIKTLVQYVEIIMRYGPVTNFQPAAYSRAKELIRTLFDQIKFQSETPLRSAMTSLLSKGLIMTNNDGDESFSEEPDPS